MTNEVVVSPVEDKNINKNLNGSPIWKNCFHTDEITDEIRGKSPKWFEYHVKFDGLKPIQCTKMIQR